MIRCRLLQTSVALIFVLIHVSNGLIKHCINDTDTRREKVLQKYPGLEEYLRNDTITAGRLGLIHFITWQDPVVKITGPPGKECLWKLESEAGRPGAKEKDKFNDKRHTGNKLRADQLNVRRYTHLISCETDDCIQFYNIITRPITKPDFPIQVYTGYEITIECTLKFMDDKPHDFDLKYYPTPIRFEWTGPNCPEKYWDPKYSEKQCKRYTNNATMLDISMDYASTKIGFEEKRSVLYIKKATLKHDGIWRCMAYDKFNVSSHSHEEGDLDLKDFDVVPRGNVNVHVKDLALAIGVPIGIMLGLLLVTILCILFCKQCTDFNVTTPEQIKQEEEKLKKRAEQLLQKALSSSSTKPAAETLSAADGDKAKV